MQCPRCKRKFPPEELKSIPIVLQRFLFPFAFRSAQVRREVRSQYCRRCCRSMNAALFFIAFGIFTMIAAWLVQKLRLLG
jgi:hypothetical protein